MIELSLGKMVLLALIALIVLGPEKLPGAARTAGALLRRVRSGWDNVKAEVERELEIEEIKRSAREAVAGAEAAQKQVKDTLKEAHDPFAEAAAMVKLSSPASTDSPTKQDDVPAEGHVISPLASITLAAPENPALETENLPREAHVAVERADRHVADDQALAGMQSELPLDQPPNKPTRNRGLPHGSA